MEIDELPTNGKINDVTESKDNCDHLDNKSPSEFLLGNSSKDLKFSKIITEKSSLGSINNITDVESFPSDSCLDRSFSAATKVASGGMMVSGESTPQKRFNPRKKVVHCSDIGEEGATLQRRFSPRLKDLPSSKRPCYATSRKCVPRQNDEQNGIRENSVCWNSNDISNPDVSSNVNGKSDSTVDLHSYEQNGLAERGSRRDSATIGEGGCSENNAEEAGKCLNSCNATISDYKQGAYERVKETIRTFNVYYQQFVQEEENEVRKLGNSIQTNANGFKSERQGAFEDHVKGSNRPDLKALSKIFETKAVMYPVKRFGHLPGIDVGYQFHTRAEMVALGFHSDWLYKVDYMGEPYKKMVEYNGLSFPLAVAIVLSGENEEDQDYSEDIYYTGEGGIDLIENKHQISCCNVALRNNLEQSIPVRVARGQNSVKSFRHKVYTYDGLYEVYECLIQKGISGVLAYKYRLRRLEGQPEPTGKQLQVNLTKEHKVHIPSEVPGLVCTDISGGQEELCIPAINLIDDAPFPSAGFTYSKEIQVAENVELPANAVGCKCKGTCTSPKGCACARLNGSKFPYVRNGGGRLLKAKDIVFECGPNCGCGPDCINRVSQRGIKYRLEVFRTPNRGWAVRTRDFVPSGAPVCEYVGVLRRTADADKDSDNDYVFEIDCLHTIKGVDGREKRLGKLPESIRSDLEKIDDRVLQATPEFCVDAGTTGNVARFINHSCEPNLFVQCVLSVHHDMRLARIVLYAAENIAPLQEITYDYGYALDSVVGPDGRIKEQPCYCGTADCRKRLY